MTAQVHRIGDGHPQPSGGEPNEELVELLEELLEKARSGEILGIAGAAAYPSPVGTIMPVGSFRSGWSSSVAMAGALENVKYRILRSLNDVY